MNDASLIRKVITILERDQDGARASTATISYSVEKTGDQVSKIVAHLKSYDSARYTRLGRNLLKIESLSAELEELRKEVKQETRELVADLFLAEDAVATRVVETVSFTFHMTKDPKATETYKYAKILEELEKHMTPQLISVLEGLKAKHKTITQKPPALRATDNAPKEESIVEGIGEQIKGFFSKLKDWVMSWGEKYDAQLDRLKAQAGMTESLDENFKVGDAVRRYNPKAAPNFKITAIDDDHYWIQAPNETNARKVSKDEIHRVNIDGEHLQALPAQRNLEETDEIDYELLGKQLDADKKLRDKYNLRYFHSPKGSGYISGYDHDVPGNVILLVDYGTGVRSKNDDNKGYVSVPFSSLEIYRDGKQLSVDEPLEPPVYEAKQAEWKLNSIGDKSLKTRGYEGNYTYNERSQRYDWIVLAPDHTIVDSGTTPDYQEMDSKVRQTIEDHRSSLKEESESPKFKLKDIVKINAPRSSAHGEYGMIDAIDEAPEEEGGNIYKVVLVGTGYWAEYEEHELEMSSSEEAMAASRQLPMMMVDEGAYEEGRKAYYQFRSTSPRTPGRRDILRNPYDGGPNKSEWQRGWDDMSEKGWTSDDVTQFTESQDCEHEWTEGVDDDGSLEEPPYDVCVSCGEVRF